LRLKNPTSPLLPLTKPETPFQHSKRERKRERERGCDSGDRDSDSEGT